jgi:ribulose-5-phosphate 4-epimerase/fuculose-1-phosphate aldolase
VTAAQELDRLVATGCQVLGCNGHDDFVWGHAAVRDPGGRGAWMKASRLGLAEVTPADVILVDRAGEVLAGSGSCHSEYPIHLEVMAARPDVGATVHTHPPHAIALAAAGVELRPVSHAATLFAGRGVHRFDKTGDLILTPELGQEVADALGDADALLMVNHGIVTVGADLPSAVVRAIALEQACHHQLLTMGFGGPRSWSSDEEAASKRRTIWSETQIQAVWDCLVRGLAISRPA